VTVNIDRLVGEPFDLEASLDLFSTIKHTRLEGLIVEYEVEQTLLSRCSSHGWRNVPALVLRRLRHSVGTEFLVVTNHHDSPLVRLVVDALRRTGDPVLVLRASGRELLLLEDASGKLISPHDVYLRCSDRPERAAPAAVTRDRVLGAYWGFAVQSPRTAQRFTREIVIKDFIVGPSSTALWDLDRFLVHDDGRILFLETKHKFPFGPRLRFGMNVGEVLNARALQSAGVLVYHVILVKPHWDKALSSTYLFYDRRARESALWIAGNMARPGFFGDSASQAPVETSLHGRGAVKYVNLELENFSVLGTNAESAGHLSERLFGLVGGGALPVLDAKTLEAHRLR